MQERISIFSFDYRITPQATTGGAPCELLTNRKLRSRFEPLYPMVRRKVETSQDKQKELHDGKRCEEVCSTGSSVLLKISLKVDSQEDR